MRLKTAPRIVLGLAVVGALAYGVNYYIDHRPKQASVDSAPQAVQDVVQPVAPISAVVQPQPTQPVAEAPSAPARTQQDAALNALLKGGTK